MKKLIDSNIAVNTETKSYITFKLHFFHEASDLALFQQ